MTQMDSDTSKQHSTLVTIGHMPEGQSALTQAIAKLFVRGDKNLHLDSAAPAPERHLRISPASVEYETDKRHYTHINDLNHDDFLKSMLTGAIRPNVAILNVSALEGLTKQIEEQIHIAKQTGVMSVVVFLDDADAVESKDQLEQVEKEIRQFLVAHDFDGENVPFVKGSAKAALEGRDPEIGEETIKKLISAIDENIPVPLQQIEQPFLMLIEDVFAVAGRGTIATGRIERGVVETGDELEIVGLGKTQRVVCAGIDMFRKEIGRGEAGDHVGLLLKGVSKDEIERGQVICEPDSIRFHSRFEATTYALDKEEGGRATPLADGEDSQFHFDTLDVEGIIEIAETDTEKKADIVVQLERPVPIEQGRRFALRKGGRTVGVGVVSKGLDDDLPPVSLPLPEQSDIILNAMKQERSTITVTKLTKSAPPDDDDHQNADYPVWFGTDRAPVFDDDRVIGYKHKRDGNLHLGRCNVFVPKGHLIGSTGSSWWKRIFRGDDRLKLLSIRPLDEATFWRELGGRLETDAQGRKIGIVFIHGYNTSFSDAAIRAAQIGFDIGIKSSMAMFSWPSMGATRGYGYDEESITASEDNLYNFLTSYVEETGVEKLHIIAHSMGNRLLMRCVQRISYDEASPLAAAMGQAILAAPDVYAETFRSHADRYVALCDRVTVYSSSKDLAVKLSRYLHGVDRVGFYPPITVHPGIDTVCATDMSVSLLGHTYFASARPLLTDIKNLIFQNSEPEYRMGLEKLEDAAGSYWRFRE